MAWQFPPSLRHLFLPLSPAPEILSFRPLGSPVPSSLWAFAMLLLSLERFGPRNLLAPSPFQASDHAGKKYLFVQTAFPITLFAFSPKHLLSIRCPKWPIYVICLLHPHINSKKSENVLFSLLHPLCLQVCHRGLYKTFRCPDSNRCFHTLLTEREPDQGLVVHCKLHHHWRAMLPSTILCCQKQVVCGDSIPKPFAHALSTLSTFFSVLREQDQIWLENTHLLLWMLSSANHTLYHLMLSITL